MPSNGGCNMAAPSNSPVLESGPEWRTYLPKDLGDFQTPASLVSDIAARLHADGRSWRRIIEPTCGSGSFLVPFLNGRYPVDEIHGVDIQESHLRQARNRAAQHPEISVLLHQANVFTFSFNIDVTWSSVGPLL